MPWKAEANLQISRRPSRIIHGFSYFCITNVKKFLEKVYYPCILFAYIKSKGEFHTVIISSEALAFSFLYF